MREKQQVIFVSDDGEEFFSSEECVRHEIEVSMSTDVAEYLNGIMEKGQPLGRHAWMRRKNVIHAWLEHDIAVNPNRYRNGD